MMRFRLPQMLAVLLPVFTFMVGCGVPIDTAMGVQMVKAMGHGVRASLLSYAMVLVCLLLLVLVRWLQSPKAVALEQLHDAPPFAGGI